MESLSHYHWSLFPGIEHSIEVRGRRGNKKIKPTIFIYYFFIYSIRESKVGQREKSHRDSVEKGSGYNGMLNEVARDEH